MCVGGGGCVRARVRGGEGVRGVLAVRRGGTFGSYGRPFGPNPF